MKGGIPWIQKLRQLDLPGAVLLLGATSCLNLALQWGGIVYPWSDSKVFGCLIGFGLLLITFLYLQFRGKESSTIPLHIFRSRTVSASCAFMMLVQVAIVLQSYYWPIYPIDRIEQPRNDLRWFLGIEIRALCTVHVDRASYTGYRRGTLSNGSCRQSPWRLDWVSNSVRAWLWKL